jgi:hypothetical protein
MGMETELKDCPSCGSAIAESAVRCTVCKSGLGHCVGCNAWIVEGTECFDCGKSTAVRVRKAAKAAAGEDARELRFEGSPVGLLFFLGLRFALAAACVAALVFAVAATPALDPAAWFLIEHGVKPPNVKGPVLWAAAGGLLLLVFFAGTFVRRFRWSRTIVLGKPIEVGLSAGSIVLNLFLTVIVLGLTAGLGLPWLYARYRRSFYRSCNVRGRSEARLDFEGAGEEVLGRFCLALLLLPLGIATGGLLFGVVSWMWLKWEQSNVLAPDRNGQMRRLRLTGSFGDYFGRWVLGWVLSVVTAGIYRPWAKAAEWRWAADHTKII